MRSTNAAKVAPAKLMPELKQLSVDKLVKDFNEKAGPAPEDEYDQL